MNALPSRHAFWLGIGYCAASLILEWLSTIGVYRGIGVTPWNPGAGLALAYVYIIGQRSWPYVIGAELLAGLLFKPSSLEFEPTLLLGIIGAVVWIITGTVMRQAPGFDPLFRTLQGLFSLLALATAAAFAHCIIFIGALWITGQIPVGVVYPASWRLIVGDIVGILVVSPLPILLSTGWRGPKVHWVHGAQLLLLVAAVWTIFGYRAASAYQLFYLLFLPVLWVSIREGMPGAIVVLNIAQLGMIIGAQMRNELIPSAGALQILMTALSFTGLLVGAVVTERQAAGQRVRDQHAALGRVLRLRSAGETAAAIAHQINQPLTAIATYAAVAQDALMRSETELVRQSLAKLANECERAAAVVRSVRDLVKQGSLSRDRVAIADIVDDLRKAHDAECKLLDIELEVEIPDTLPPILADRVQLEQALDNLLTNSIEAIRESGRPGKIRIAAGLDRGDTQVSVEDNGPGFAPGLDAIATTPFMTTKINGTGLGLAIARSVAEAHGGSLSVDHRGSGACVRLRLPVASPATALERYDVKIHQHH